LNIVKTSLIALAVASPALADADYSLSCNFSNGSATVIVCNSGNSSEGNNKYVTVKACNFDGDCDDDYDLFYIYAASNSCESVGSIDLDVDGAGWCSATFRD
jgi:hypothetical protein